MCDRKIKCVSKVLFERAHPTSIGLAVYPGLVKLVAKSRMIQMIIFLKCSLFLSCKVI